MKKAANSQRKTLKDLKISILWQHVFLCIRYKTLHTQVFLLSHQNKDNIHVSLEYKPRFLIWSFIWLLESICSFTIGLQLGLRKYKNNYELQCNDLISIAKTFKKRQLLCSLIVYSGFQATASVTRFDSVQLPNHLTAIQVDELLFWQTWGDADDFASQ